MRTETKSAMADLFAPMACTETVLPGGGKCWIYGWDRQPKTPPTTTEIPTTTVTTVIPTTPTTTTKKGRANHRRPVNKSEGERALKALCSQADTANDGGYIFAMSKDIVLQIVDGGHRPYNARMQYEVVEQLTKARRKSKNCTKYTVHLDEIELIKMANCKDSFKSRLPKDSTVSIGPLFFPIRTLENALRSLRLESATVHDIGGSVYIATMGINFGGEIVIKSGGKKSPQWQIGQIKE